MSTARQAVVTALDAFEALPFRELVKELAVHVGEHRALAYKPGLVQANILLQSILTDLNQPPQL